MNRVISIGYGRHLFEPLHDERKRVSACADLVAAYDMIIFSKKIHALQTEQVSPTLTLHPTNSTSSITSLVRAFFIARSLIKKSTESVTVTAQDPFETALVAIILKKLYRVTLVIQEHGDFFGSPHWRRESILNRPRYYFGLWALRQADVVRVVSQRTKHRFEARGIKHVVTFPVHIDTNSLISSHVDPLVDTLRQSGACVFLSVARFVPQKNFPLLLHAFARVHEKDGRAVLVLVGKGKDEKLISDIISQFSEETKKAIHILPWSNDVGSLMRAASVYVLSSNYEGWGRVLIEAMVAQLPIVTTNVGCAEEVVVHGTHGLVVPIDDEVALSQAMMTLLSDTTLYNQIKQNLSELSIENLPGTNAAAYATQWAKIFG